MIYYFRYVLGWKEPPKAAMIRGSSFHKSANWMFLEAMQTKWPEKSKVKEKFESTFKSDMEKAGEVKLDEGESKQSMTDSGVNGVGVYYDGSRKFKPKLTEEKFRIDFKGEDFVMEGYIDLVESDNLRELKTRARNIPPPESPDFQTSIYEIGLNQKIDAVYHDSVVMRKKDAEFIAHKRLPSTDTLKKSMLMGMKSTIQQIGQNLYHMTDNPMICSSRNCGFWNRCKGRLLQGKEVDHTPYKGG